MLYIISDNVKTKLTSARKNVAGWGMGPPPHPALSPDGGEGNIECVGTVRSPSAIALRRAIG
jgi:hypothetical protein